MTVYWYMFEGVRVSTCDEDACGFECGAYLCTRLKGHKGDHIAHVFSEEDSRPVEVVAVHLEASEGRRSKS